MRLLRQTATAFAMIDFYPCSESRPTVGALCLEPPSLGLAVGLEHCRKPCVRQHQRSTPSAPLLVYMCDQPPGAYGCCRGFSLSPCSQLLPHLNRALILQHHSSRAIRRAAWRGLFPLGLPKARRVGAAWDPSSCSRLLIFLRPRCPTMMRELVRVTRLRTISLSERRRGEETGSGVPAGRGEAPR